MRHSQTAQATVSTRSSAVAEADAIYEKTQISTWHQPPEVSAFEIEEKSQTLTIDLSSPVTMRGDMLVW